MNYSKTKVRLNVCLFIQILPKFVRILRQSLLFENVSGYIVAKFQLNQQNIQYRAKIHSKIEKYDGNLQ